MATRILFAAWGAIPALLLLTGGHRLIYGLLDGLPDLAVAVVAGLANLAWYELGYVIGTGVKRADVYVLVPWVGIATGLFTALASAREGWFRNAALLHAAAGVAFGGLALAVLLWRTLRGFGDPWRMATTCAFVAAHAAWCARLVWRWRRSPAAEGRIAVQV